MICVFKKSRTTQRLHGSPGGSPLGAGCVRTLFLSLTFRAARSWIRLEAGARLEACRFIVEIHLSQSCPGALAALITHL